jgi:hypothetical protein
LEGVSITELIEAIGVEGSQGLTLFANGRSQFMCKGRTWNFGCVEELEAAFNAKAQRSKEPENVPRGTTLLSNAERGTRSAESEEKVAKEAKEFTGFNQTEANAS